MTYREKMIHALETVPVHDGVIRMSEEVRDKIVELLKEQQEPIKPYLDFDGHDVWRCGNCHTTIFHVYELTDIGCEKNYAQYCRHCGKRVKWDDQETQAETNTEDPTMPGMLAVEPDQHP